MSNLMLVRVIFPKYLEPGNYVVDVHIDGLIVPNTSIKIRAAINVTNKETILNINLQGTLRKTKKVLQLVDLSRVTSEGIVEDVMVSIYCWDYPIDFLVL